MPHKPTILVVDDEATLRAVFADLLTSQGYRCITAANAVDALNIIEANVIKLDVLVTDIRMPGQIDGLDLANKVRQLQPDTAILLISGHAAASGMKEIEARGYRLLQKPFRHFHLEAAIREELAKRPGTTPPAADQEGGSVVPIKKARDREPS
ncbi:MAG TPA: response regulator [Stellaceae bacterium]